MSNLAVPAFGPTQAYEPPAFSWPGEAATEHEWVLFVVFVLTYIAALSWAAYCISRNGSPEVEFEWWRWKITCNRWGNT
jgi:hypothetical protein